MEAEHQETLLKAGEGQWREADRLVLHCSSIKASSLFVVSARALLRSVDHTAVEETWILWQGLSTLSILVSDVCNTSRFPSFFPIFSPILLLIYPFTVSHH